MLPTFDIGSEVMPATNFRGFALEGMSKNEVVYACVRTNAVSFSEMPLRVWKQNGQHKLPDEMHPIRQLFRRPNPFIRDEVTLWETLSTSYDIAGEWFLFKARNPAGRTVEIWPLRADAMSYVGGMESPVKTWLYTPPGGSKPIPMDPMDVMHCKISDPLDPVRGLPPLRAAARAVDSDNLATDFIAKFMANNGVPSGALILKREYDDELQKRLMKQWSLRHAGAKNAGRLMVLWNEADFKQFTVTPRNMEFPDLRAISETRICMVFGVAPIIINSWAGLQRSTYANFAEANRSYYDKTMLPRGTKFGSVIEASFMDPEDPDSRSMNGLSIGFDWRDIRALQEELTSQWSRVKDGFSAGMLGRRQSLKILGLDEADPDDVFIVQGATNVDDGTAATLVAGEDVPALMDGTITEDEAEERAVTRKRRR